MLSNGKAISHNMQWQTWVVNKWGALANPDCQGMNGTDSLRFYKMHDGKKHNRGSFPCIISLVREENPCFPRPLCFAVLAIQLSLCSEACFIPSACPSKGTHHWTVFLKNTKMFFTMWATHADTHRVCSPVQSSPPPLPLAMPLEATLKPLRSTFPPNTNNTLKRITALRSQQTWNLRASPSVELQ